MKYFIRNNIFFLRYKFILFIYFYYTCFWLSLKNYEQLIFLILIRCMSENLWNNSDGWSYTRKHVYEILRY